MHIRLNKTIGVLLLCSLLFTGCSGGTPVRHLSSDAILLIPGQTVKKDVLSYMGEPDERRMKENGEEVWVYSQVRKSLMRKTPYIGERLGHEEYDVVNVSFSGETVTSCVYRLFGEEEFKRGEKVE